MMGLSKNRPNRQKVSQIQLINIKRQIKTHIKVPHKTHLTELFLGCPTVPFSWTRYDKFSKRKKKKEEGGVLLYERILFSAI